MSRRGIYFALILFVCAISAVAGISANYTASATLPAPQNVTLSGMTEGIDVRWDIPPGSDEVANYQIAYQAMERRGIAGSWAYMWTQGKVSTHLIRHLAGGYEYRVYVRSCSTQCNSEWAYGGTVWTKTTSSVVYTVVQVPTPTPRPTVTPTPTPTPNPYPEGTDPVLQLDWHIPRHTEEGYLSPIMYYVVMGWTGLALKRILQVAWREASTEDDWSVIMDFSGSVRDLKPATYYEVKARRRLLENPGFWAADEDFRPWSQTYTVRTSDVPDPQPCTPKTGKVRKFGEERISLGSSRGWKPIVLENPDTQEWEYTFRTTITGWAYKQVVIDQDGQWTFKSQPMWSDPVITTGQIANFDGGSGARNRFAIKVSDNKFYVNDVPVQIELPEKVGLFHEDRGIIVESSEWAEYEAYMGCRHWWHYW